MLKDDIKVLVFKGENVGLAASGIVNDLVASNERNPWDALLDLHETKLYSNLSENDMWTLHHAKLYGLYCEETGEAKSVTLRSWDYEDLDAVEFASKVFEVYRILTEKEVPPYILDAFFITKHVYAFLYELYENHDPMTVLTAVEKVYEYFARNGVFDERIELKELYEETPLERFFKENGAVVVDDDGNEVV